MKRFAFRFQRILEIKERVEETRKIALGEVVAVLNREQEELNRLQQTRALYRQASHRLATQRLEPAFLGVNDNYLLRLQREILEQSQRLAAVDAEVVKQRAALMEATRERRVYETLRERAAEQYERESKRQERIEMDEVGGQIYRRSGMSTTGWGSE